MAATSRKIFLTAYNSLKGQRKTVQKLLSLIRAFKRLQEPLLLWSPHMLHTLRGTVYRALAQGGDIEWLGIQLSIFLSLSSLKPLNSSQPSANMLREVTD